MPKDPIPFRPRRVQQPLPRRKGASELDEWLWYWSVRIQHPWALHLTGWTETMLWGNALVAGLGYGILWGIRSGFSLLILIGSVASLLMLAWIWYQGIPWLVGRLYHRFPPHTRRPLFLEGVRNNLLGLSGIFPIACWAAGFNRSLGLGAGVGITLIWLYRSIRLHCDRRTLPALMETAAATAMMVLASWILIGAWL